MAKEKHAAFADQSLRREILRVVDATGITRTATQYHLSREKLHALAEIEGVALKRFVPPMTETPLKPMRVIVQRDGTAKPAVLADETPTCPPHWMDIRTYRDSETRCMMVEETCRKCGLRREHPVVPREVMRTVGTRGK
ncbi:MAG: hypothetical protein KGL39_05755 [Patescibacteria group bacterium]|nr:hypothetical protein [Patescibacteria group bacterium]